jgi:hypothetical protein
MDNHMFRSAWLGAGIALLLTFIVAVFTGGGANGQPPAPAATAMEAPSPTLGPTVQAPAATPAAQ